MKAVQIDAFGSVDQLYGRSDVPVPQLLPKQILVKTKVIAIDPYDVKFVQGFMGEADKLPLIPGSSVAGVVVAIGSDVADFKVGDRVAATRHHKSYAEFVPLGQSMAAKIPDEIDDETAVASVLGALTGYEAVTTAMTVKAGQKVLIQGGAGSVGSTAVQTALYLGAQVYATAKPADFDYLVSLGDVVPVDYTTDYENTLSDFDAVLDTVGGTTTVKSAKILRTGGKLRSLVGVNESEISSYNIDAAAAVHKGKGAELAALFALIQAQKVKIRIGKVLPFTVENLRAEHQAVRDHKSGSGKVVLKVRD